MISPIRHINIHNHSNSNEDVISIRNVFLDNYFEFNNTDGSFLSVGYHPWQILERTDASKIKTGLELAATDNNVIAIGEAGLDKSKEPNAELQEKVLVAHVEVSEEYQKPLVIHCVRAFQEVLSIRRGLQAKQPWIFHGFNGSPQLAMQIINAGCFVSFGAALLKGTTRAAHSLLHLETNQFFLETDDSHHSIYSIYEMASLIKQIPVNDLKAQLHENFVKVFGK